MVHKLVKKTQANQNFALLKGKLNLTSVSLFRIPMNTGELITFAYSKQIA